METTSFLSLKQLDGLVSRLKH